MKINNRKVILCLAFLLILMGFQVNINYAETAFKYESEANILKEMNIFRGDGSGLNLDKIPTRNEAAVMIVRLLGKEEESRSR